VEGRFGLCLGCRESKNTIERKRILTGSSPRGGFFPGIVPIPDVHFLCDFYLVIAL